MISESIPSPATAVPHGADGAVGVPDAKHWFVAVVNNRSERAVADRLATQGYETYVATQNELRVWSNGRKKQVERVVITATVFVRCTEHERLEIVRRPDIFRFLANRAASANQYSRPVAIISDHEMANLRFALGNTDTPVEFADHIYGERERVKVIRGKLKGYEGEVIRTADGHRQIVIALDALGYAKITIDATDLQPQP